MSLFALLYCNSYIRKLEQENKRLREVQTAQENAIKALYEFLVAKGFS